MRHKIVFCFSVFLLMFGASAATSFGQYYSSGEQCVQALENGTVIFYTPHANNLFKPINPRTEVLTTLEEDECQQMIVDRSRNMSDFYWIAQPKGTQEVKELGGLTIKRRYSCGNPIGQRMQKRIPPTPTPTPVATPLPRPKCANLDITIEDARKIPGMIVTDDGQCVVPQPTPQPTPPPQQCPTCIKIGYVANKEGVLNKKQAGLSAIFGGGASAAGSSGGLKRRALYGLLGAGISAGANVGTRAMIKDARGDKSFTFTAQKPGEQAFQFTLKKGESYNANGLKIDWKGDHWELDDPNCYGVFQPRYTFIFTPVPIISRRSNVQQQQAVKNQTLPPNRTGIAQTGQGNRIPGGGVQPTYAPGTTVPTRPTIANGGLQYMNINGQQTLVRVH